jgi:hypothetical protein
LTHHNRGTSWTFRTASRRPRTATLTARSAVHRDLKPQATLHADAVNRNDGSALATDRYRLLSRTPRAEQAQCYRRRDHTQEKNRGFLPCTALLGRTQSSSWTGHASPMLLLHQADLTRSFARTGNFPRSGRIGALGTHLRHCAWNVIDFDGGARHKSGFLVLEMGSLGMRTSLAMRNIRGFV